MMKKHGETIASRYLRDLRLFKRSFAILLIFCIAECANGSCLSYGHSCWGAHGKRSFNGARISQHRQPDTSKEDLPIVGVETNRISARTNGRNPWLVPHLITGRMAIPADASIVGKPPGNRWHEQQGVLALPAIWGNDYETTRNDGFRNEKAEFDKNIDDSKDLDDPLFLSEQMIKPRDDATDILLMPSRKEYADHRPSSLRLYKILADSSGDDALH